MKYQAALLVAAAAIPATLAQTFTKCDPTKKDCPCDAALGKTITHDFSNGPSEYFDTESWFNITYESDGVHLAVTKKGDAPTLLANKYIFGGRLDCTMKIAPGQGIVSSLVFQSDDLDEIDWEWLGGKPMEAQSNYFGKGNTKTYNRGEIHEVTDAASKFHKYSIDWTKDKITWYLDDKPLRTLTPEISNQLYQSPNYYPQTPMQIKVGPWAAGDPSNEPGVIEWAGGEIDYPSGPYTMVIKDITLTDYSVGATEYCYGDRSGSWDSIEISKDPKKGNNKAATTSAEPESTSKTAKPTTLATSTTEKEEKESTSTKSTSSSASSTKRPSATVTDDEIGPKVTQGVPDSIGNVGGEPQNKGVSSTTESRTSTATNEAANASNTPSSASSVRTTGFGALVAVLVAASFL